MKEALWVTLSLLNISAIKGSGLYPDQHAGPARLYASEAALDGILEDQSLNQPMNVSTLPGITKAAIAIPDAHQGYATASLSAVLRDYRVPGRRYFTRRYRLRYQLRGTTAIY